MPKATTPSRSAAAARRHNPLADDVMTTGHIRTQPSKKSKRRSQAEGDEEGTEGGAGSDGVRFVDAKMSRKILQIGQELADEDVAEQQKSAKATKGDGGHTAFDFESRGADEEGGFSDDDDEGGKFGEDEWGDEEDDVEEVVCFFCFALLGNTTGDEGLIKL